MSTPIWLAHGDARGSRLGVKPSSAEHPGCTDLVRSFGHGYEVIACLTPEALADLRAVLAVVTDGA